MEYFDAVIKAIDFIEAHLCDDISAHSVAEHIGFSSSHFHRLFQLVVKDTVTGYIRKRRLSNSALELLDTKCNILEIALRHQFESHEAFTRAFTKMFGVTPKLLRQEGNTLREPHRLIGRPQLDAEALRHLVSGVHSEPRMVRKPAFSVVGLREHSSQASDFGGLWERFTPRMRDITNSVDPMCSMGVICRNPGSIGVDFDYLACMEVRDTGEVPEGLICRQFLEADYAVFTHKGSLRHLEETWLYIYCVWLVKSRFVRGDAPEIESYHIPRFKGAEHPDSELDIYVPIRE